MNLQNFKSIYSLVEDEYGLEPDPDTWEEMALVGWEKINNNILASIATLPQLRIISLSFLVML